MRFLEVFVLRFVIWVLLPLAIVVLAIGPKRVARWLKQFWNWLWVKRLEPEAILSQVVKQHEKHIAALRAALARSETAERDIVRNMSKSDENIANLEEEAESRVAGSDDRAKAAPYKLNLNAPRSKSSRSNSIISGSRSPEAAAGCTCRNCTATVRGRPQYSAQPVGRGPDRRTTIRHRQGLRLLQRRAEWKQAEGMVHEKALSARAVEEVYKDVAEIPVAGLPRPSITQSARRTLAESKSHQVPQSPTRTTNETPGNRTNAALPQHWRTTTVEFSRNPGSDHASAAAPPPWSSTCSGNGSRAASRSNRKSTSRVHRWGKNLPEGEIVAPDDSVQGVMLEVSGRRPAFPESHHLGYEIHLLVNVPAENAWY